MTEIRPLYHPNTIAGVTCELQAREEILPENTVAITAEDQLLWNGNAVTRDELSAQVSAASAREEQPLLRFEPDALASYDTSARTITLIKDAGATRFAFVGNHSAQRRYAGHRCVLVFSVAQMSFETV